MAVDIGNLNDMQRQAVLTTQGPLLILAGAGSGKTRTLTHRIAYILEQRMAAPWEMLAITFTNKAAREMRERIAAMVGERVESMWVSTFHAACVQMLRRSIERLPGYSRWFSIYDDDDSIRVIRQCLSEMNLSDRYYAPRTVRSLISSAKNNLMGPDEYGRELMKTDFRGEKIAAVYRRYDEILRENNALDFDDLLVRPLELFVACPDVLDEYRRRFRYIHVDEYQDTNEAQYQLVKLLSSQHRNLCVVGDDDQSIYGWRGANIQNILNFEKDFPDAKVIRLERNYRSTSVILDTANAVIAHNVGRKEKRLWTDRRGGERVTLYTADIERDEARFVCDTIISLARELSYGDIAVLYRLNAQSRSLEEALMRRGIPYRIYGGIRFYDRAEIKDIIAYLRLTVNPSDMVSLERIINTPRRGIGEATVEKLKQRALATGRPVLALLSDDAALEETLSARPGAKVREFARLIERLRAQREALKLPEFVAWALEETGIRSMYADQNTDEAEGRLQNLSELLSAVQEFAEGREEPTLEDFLENVALVTDLDAMREGQRAISLMTMHAAKGLEFPAVFVVGMEEGIFPHQRAFDDESEMEEERRLCYVAITRAKDRLYLTCCRQRLLFGTQHNNMPSRFLREMPRSCVDSGFTGKNRPFVPSARPSASRAAAPARPPGTPVLRSQPQGASAPRLRPAAAGESFRTGDRVRHKTFGSGVVISEAGEGADRKLTVAFEGQGIRTLKEAVAGLTRDV